MKIQYKIGLLALGAMAMSSCARHDVIDKITTIGQEVPAAYWELSSTVCKAGEEFGFQGKYSVSPGHEADRSEVWYQIVRSEEASVLSKLGGTSLGYTHKSARIDTVRTYQPMAVFPHSAAQWSGHEFIVTGTVPVSRTLAPVKWADITTWDEDNFNAYYPADFKEGFLNTVIGYLTDAATAQNYYNALRSIYISYDFPTQLLIDNGLLKADELEADKSDLWFSTTQASDDAIVGYYYFTVQGDKNVPVEISIEERDNITDVPTYPVYKSCDWVFCRYDDNAGAIVSSIREEWLPKFKAILVTIPFEDWIYDSANACYKVDFSRSYSLNTQFRVYDKEGNEGRAYDILNINVN